MQPRMRSERMVAIARRAAETASNAKYSTGLGSTGLTCPGSWLPHAQARGFSGSGAPVPAPRRRAPPVHLVDPRHHRLDAEVRRGERASLHPHSIAEIRIVEQRDDARRDGTRV